MLYTAPRPHSGVFEYLNYLKSYDEVKIMPTVPEFIFTKLGRNPSSDIMGEYNEVCFMPRKAVRIILAMRIMEDECIYIGNLSG